MSAIPDAKTRWYNLGEPQAAYPDIGDYVFALMESSIPGALPRVGVVRRVAYTEASDSNPRWDLIENRFPWRQPNIHDPAMPLPGHLKIICWRHPMTGEIDENPR